MNTLFNMRNLNVEVNGADDMFSVQIILDEEYIMRTIKSYQEQVQDTVENVIAVVEKQYKAIAEVTFDYAEKVTSVDTIKSKHNEITDLVYGKAYEINKLIGKNTGDVILKFEKPQTVTSKAKATAKKATTTAKKKATAAKASTAKATKKVVKKIEEATA